MPKRLSGDPPPSAGRGRAVGDSDWGAPSTHRIVAAAILHEIALIFRRL